MNNLDKFLRQAGLGGLFLVPFVPLIVASSMFFPYITGKNFAFRILILITTLACTILAFRHPEYRPRKSPILVVVTAFIILIGLSDLFGVYPYRSFWSNYERMEGYIGLLHVFAYFLVATVLLNKERLWGWLLHSSLFVSIILAVFGFLQMTGRFVSGQGGTRLDARFGNATYFAIYASLSAFLALFLLVRAKMRYQRIIYAIIAILNVIMLYYTATRGAILGFLSGLLLAGFITGILLPGRPRKIALGLVSVIVLIVLIFIGSRDSSFVQKSQTLARFANISISDHTTTSRLTIWGMAYEGWKERPLLGWGQENFNLIFNKYYKPELYIQESWFDRAHNIYVEWFVAGGILGGLSYLSLFIALLWLLWRRPKESQHRVLREWSVAEKSVLTGAVIAYAINNFFVFDNLISLVIFFSLLAIVHLHAVGVQDEKTAKNTPIFLGPRKTALAAVLVILAAVIFWVADVRPIRASRTLIRAMSPQPDKGIPENFRLFRKALAFNTFAAPEAREQFVRFATQIRGADGASGELKTEIINDALEEMRAQVKETPDDARYRLFLGNYYISIGRQDDAIRELTEAVRLSPGKQQMYFALTAAYINKGDNEQALATAKYAYELEKDNPEALINYATAAIFAGQRVLADELIAQFPDKNIVVTDNRFFTAYLATKQYDKLVVIWETRIKADPQNAQKYTSLAASYLMAGRRGDAIRAIEQAMILEPKFKQQGAYLIGEIRAGRNPVQQ